MHAYDIYSLKISLFLTFCKVQAADFTEKLFQKWEPKKKDIFNLKKSGKSLTLQTGVEPGTLASETATIPILLLRFSVHNCYISIFVSYYIYPIIRYLCMLYL